MSNNLAKNLQSRVSSPSSKDFIKVKNFNSQGLHHCFFQLRITQCQLKMFQIKLNDTVQLPGRFYEPCVLQGFLFLFTEEKLKPRMDFACVPREKSNESCAVFIESRGYFPRGARGSSRMTRELVAVAPPRSILFNPT